MSRSARLKASQRAVGLPSKASSLAYASPAGFLILVTVTTAAASLSSAVGLRPFSQATSSLLFAVGVLGVALTGWVWCARVWSVGQRVGWLPLLPGLVILGYAAGVRFLTDGDRVEWFLGGDHVRHLIFVAEEQSAGNLSYGVQPYPRGWHTLVTSIWSATGPKADGPRLHSLIDLMSTMTWLLPAVLSVATGAFTVSLASRVGLSSRWAGIAGLLAASGTLLPPFLSTYQALGFENSLVGAVAVVVAAQCALTVPRLETVVIAAAAVVTVAHAWQLLLPAVGLAFLVVTWRAGNAGVPRWALALLWALVAVVAAPSVGAVVADIGLGHGTDSDVEAPYPLVVLVAVALACVHLCGAASTRQWAWLPVSVVATPALTGLALAAVLGISVSHYYPSKLIWHTTAIGLAPLAVAGTQGGLWLMHRANRGLSVAAGGVFRALVVGVVLYALITPAGAFVGAWSSVDGPKVLGAVTSEGAGRAQVVWLGSLGNDTIGRILLDFYRAGSTTARTPQEPQDVPGECRILRSSQAPAVLTDRPADEVRSRYACVPDVTVVAVAANGG
jgi:hypothetical protein